jgi:hypothetical protein
MRQVRSHRATEELMHAGPKAASAAADDDHLRIKNLGEPPEGMTDISGELTKLDAYAFLVGDCPNPIREATIEDRGIPIWLIWIDRP